MAKKTIKKTNQAINRMGLRDRVMQFAGGLSDGDDKYQVEEEFQWSGRPMCLVRRPRRHLSTPSNAGGVRWGNCVQFSHRVDSRVERGSLDFEGLTRPSEWHYNPAKA